MGIFDELSEIEQDAPDFFLFEPWDIEPRTPEHIAQAKKDGINLYAPELVDIIGRDPKPFQSGVFLDQAAMQVSLACTQGGKSIAHLIDVAIRFSHELPIAFRYDKGEITDTKRFCKLDTPENTERTLMNVRRFGRYSLEGEFIDKPKVDMRTKRILGEELKVKWDCGFVEGAGKYPEAKLAPAGSMIWICTTAKALDMFWWPRFNKKHQRLIPEYFLDKSKGVDGFSNRDNITYFRNGCSIKGLTYEMGYTRAEAVKVLHAVIDEEPDDERWLPAVTSHAHTVGWAMTPYRGITWSRPYLFDNPSPEKIIYHCTAYDSPYHDEQSIGNIRRDSKPWDIKARVYGLPAEQTGRPYYDREKIQVWIDKWIPSHKPMRIVPDGHFTTVPELMETPVMGIDAGAMEPDVWEIYEEPEPQYAYFCGVDWGKGTKIPDEAIKEARANRNCACIMREPDISKNEKDPIMVANIRSTLETSEFARIVLYGCRWYNNSLFAPEARGQDAGAGIAETRDYPFFYLMTVIKDATKKTTEILGFDTNARTRPILFGLVGDWIKNREPNDHPDIPHMYTLKELAGCIVGKNGRPDHASNGTLDSVIPFGICLYVYIHAREQILNNSAYSEIILDKRGSMRNSSHSGNPNNRGGFQETRPIIGSNRGLDERAFGKKFGPSYVEQRRMRNG